MLARSLLSRLPPLIVYPHTHPLRLSLSPTPVLVSFFAQIKGVLNSSQQLAISFERQQASSSGGDQGGGGSGSGSGVGQASPSLGFAYRRTPRSNAYIQPRGFGGGGVAGSAKKGGKGGGAPVPSSSRLLSEGALTPSAKSGILSPDAYLSGGVKHLNIPTDTEERRQRFSSSRPMIRGAAAATPNPTDGRRPQRDVSGISNGSGVEEVKGETAPTVSAAAVAAAAVTGTSDINGSLPASNGNSRVEFAAASPDGSARRNTGGGASPPPSTGGIGTDVRAAATGADESLLDASPAAGGGSNGGRLFQGESGGGGDGASSITPRLDLEEYDTEPPMAELVAMTEKSLRAVSGFVVSRQGYGSIAWKEPVDLRGVDIGSAVSVDWASCLFL